MAMLVADTIVTIDIGRRETMAINGKGKVAVVEWAASVGGGM